jgi:hypothetical protein
MPYKDLEKRRINNRKKYIKNKEEILRKAKIYRDNNVEKYRERAKTYYEKNKEKRKEYRQKNTENYNKWERKKRKNDPLYRFKKNFVGRLRVLLKKTGDRKTTKTSEIIGLSIIGLREHLESQWEPWMNWDNYGKYKSGSFNYGWDIDHIIPTSTATTMEEMVKLNHYTNLKPLCSTYNRHIKRDLI